MKNFWSYFIVLIASASLLMPQALDAQCYPDRHTTNIFDSWVSCETSLNPNPSRGDSHWIRYDFGSLQTVYDVSVWNLNHPDYLKSGVRDMLVEYSDVANPGSNDWMVLDTFTIARGTASSFYEGYRAFDFQGADVRHVLITALNNHGGGCYGFSEIRFYTADQPQTTFDLTFISCEADQPMLNLSGGFNLGGYYEGKGVVDKGNDKFDFYPAEAGPGEHRIRYRYGTRRKTTYFTVLSCQDELCLNCPDCGDFDAALLHANPIPENAYYDHDLNATGIVQSSSRVDLRAKDEIKLEGGFEVKADANFTADFRDCDENLALNPDMEAAQLDPWEMYVNQWNPVSAITEVVTTGAISGQKAVHMQTTMIDSVAWHIALRQFDISIEADERYRLSFFARSPINSKFIATIQQQDNPWSSALWNEVQLDSYWKEYTLEFVAPFDGGINGMPYVMIGFYLGAYGGDFYFDKFKLIKL